MKTLRLITWVFISSCILLSAVEAQSGWRKGEMEIKIEIKSEVEAKKLKELNLSGDYFPNNTAKLYVVEAELQKLKSIGIGYEILEENLDQRTVWTTKDAYHTYQEIIDLMDSLETAFPDICKKYVVGTSVSGRELSYLKISDNVTTDETEPELFFDAGIHGDEVGGPENAVRFARYICKEYATNTTIANLIDNRETFIYCMVNPDGRVAMSRYNTNGVDLNRDWGYMWNGEGSSGGAYSQVESKALRDVMYNNQFVVHTTYHSGIEYISQPWSYRSSQCADHPHIDNLGGVYASTSGYANIPHAQGNTGMYPINGSTKDCNYGINGSVSWSMEISESKQPPTSQIGYYYSINQPAMLAMMEYAGYGVNGVVTDASTGDPIQAVVFVDDLFPVYADPTGGDFHKWLIPGTYDITVKANGYQTTTVTDIVVDADGTDMISIQMNANTEENYIYKLVSCRIPDNNDADEGLTHQIIGAEDDLNYSIGKNGWVVFDMQESIPDKQGNDIKIIEGDSSPEGYSLFASDNIDGPYTYIADGNGTTEFDLADGGILFARYFKITDDGDGQGNVDNAGFDLDAAQKLPSPPGPYLLVQGKAIEEVVGDGNGRIDPGETINLTVTLMNNGDDVANGITGNLTTSSEYVTITSASGDFGALNPGENNSATFTLEIDADAPEATPFTTNLDIEANTGSYVNSFSFNYYIGLVVEDFETGDFSAFNWTFEGDANWITTGSNVYEGSYSAQSGDISDNEESTLEITIDVPVADSVTFWKKVSCEDGSSDNWDYLIFLIDDIEQGRWDGEVDWSKEQYYVSEGQHTLTWTYHKDVTESAGSDCAWIDYVIMPGNGGTNPVALEVEVSASPLTICAGETVQLQATASGGTSNYTYNWTPGILLNDSTIMNPTVDLNESTTFTVAVDDGQNQISGNVSINVNPIPETPIITLVDDTVLHSDAAEGNQWYDLDGEISGATENTYSPDVSGTYYTIVTSASNCVSEASNQIFVVIPDGISEIADKQFLISPNPSNGNFYIANTNNEISDIQLLTIDGVLIHKLENTINENSIQINTRLKAGIYIMKLKLKDNKIALSKIVIE